MLHNYKKNLATLQTLQSLHKLLLKRNKGLSQILRKFTYHLFLINRLEGVKGQTKKHTNSLTCYCFTG